MSKELLTLTVSHAVDGRRPIPLQLKVHRPEHFGGVSISFLEPCGARISILQDLKNLLARPSDRVTPFTQGRHFQHNTLVMVWRTLRIRSTRRKQYAREYGSSNQSLAQHKKLASFPPAFYTISRGLGVAVCPRDVHAGRPNSAEFRGAFGKGLVEPQLFPNDNHPRMNCSTGIGHELSDKSIQFVHFNSGNLYRTH